MLLELLQVESVEKFIMVFTIFKLTEQIVQHFLGFIFLVTILLKLDNSLFSLEIDILPKQK